MTERLSPQSGGSGLDDITALAEEAARAGAAAALEVLTRLPSPTALRLRVKTAPGDFVTEADEAAERAIATLLQARRPHDGLIAEEGGALPSRTGLTWLIDPLDGTANLSRGIFLWAVSVAAEVDERLVAGAIVDPRSVEVFTATAGGGARLDGVRIPPPQRVEVDGCLVGTGLAYDSTLRTPQLRAIHALSDAGADVRCLGSAALQISWVAAGRLDAFVEAPLERWDWAAAALIAAEAGAVVGQVVPETGPRGVLVTTSGLYGHIVERLPAEWRIDEVRELRGRPIAPAL